MRSNSRGSVALRESIAALRAKTRLRSGDYYNIACTQSLLSACAAEIGSGLTAADGRAAADDAMATLRLAVAAGWHDAAWAKSDTDLIPLRGRTDFRLFIMEIAFPSEPLLAGPLSQRRRRVFDARPSPI